MESPPGAPPLPDGRGQVSLQRVTLRYDGAEPSLTGIDLEVEPGRTIALVGPTASGKTSLVGLLARLYDPSEGRVVIDGADIRDVDLGSLRSEIAFVADDSFLFSDTVAGNIAYARPDATREQIEAAARRAQAHDFISRLARRLRHGGRRARADPLRRPAPAGGDRAGAAGRAAHPDPRRRDLLGRRAHEAQIKARPARGDGGPDDVHRRPPPLHHLARRRDRGDGPGADRRPRHARGAARALPAVRGDRREGTGGLRLPAAGPGGAGGAGAGCERDERRPELLRPLPLASGG